MCSRKHAIRAARKRMFGTISGAALEEIHNSGSVKLLILDARSPREFRAGHIIDAHSVTTFDSFCALFTDAAFANATLVVCHCEFSNQRGPELAEYLRKYDLHLNSDSLRFRNVTILSGGFSEYHMTFPKRCIGTYFPESDCGAQKEESAREREVMRERIDKLVDRTIHNCPSST
jgi:rhodanese-related sulfurtransferase